MKSQVSELKRISEICGFMGVRKKVAERVDGRYADPSIPNLLINLFDLFVNRYLYNFDNEQVFTNFKIFIAYLLANKRNM